MNPFDEAVMWALGVLITLGTGAALGWALRGSRKRDCPECGDELHCWGCIQKQLTHERTCS